MSQMLTRPVKTCGMKEDGIGSLITLHMNFYLLDIVVISALLDKAKAVPPCPLSFRVPLTSPFVIVPIHGHPFKHLLPPEIIILFSHF